MCQITGKPNQVIKPAQLRPSSATDEPFDHIIIDCVVPLPPTKSGAKYLCTVMCWATRYPAAYLLQSITTRSIVKALSIYFNLWHSQSLQSDQGSNFSSHVFAQGLKQLLEHFHQSLKPLLCSFCAELGKDWKEGLPWLMLAAR